MASCISDGPKHLGDFLKTLPDSYRRALNVYTNVLWPLELPLMWHAPLCEGIAHVALTTPILEDMRNPEGFLFTDFGEYLSEDIARVPDERLGMVARALEQPYTREAMRTEVRSALERIFGTRSDEEQFDAYCDLPVEDKKDVNDTLRATAITVCSQHVPFGTLTDDEVHTFEEQLWDTWARHLPNMAAREANRAEPTSARPLRAQLKYFTDRIEYAPSHPGFGDILMVNFDARIEVLEYASREEALLYVHFRHNPLNEPLGMTTSLPVPPGGAYVVLHARGERDGGLGYTFPMLGVPPENRHAACFICCDANQLAIFMDELDAVDHVRTVPQWPHHRWKPCSCPGNLASARHHPLVVILSASTSNHWWRTLQEMVGDAQHWLYHGEKHPTSLPLRLFLLLGDIDGRVVWARPTSPMVYEWFKMSDGLPFNVKPTPVLPEMATLGWKDRLELACHHYATMSW